MATRKVGILVHCQNRSALWILITVSLFVVMFLGFLVINPGAAANASQVSEKLRVSQAAYTYAREYYLSKTTTNGLGAWNVCAQDYHMASLWEIIDPTNLRYNTSLGIYQDDQGFGPPSYYEGWVRTGFSSDVLNIAGRANCNAWSSNSGSDFGSSAYLPNDWNGSKDLFIWKTNAFPCSMPMPVWCLADELLKNIYLPVIKKN